MTPVIHTLDEEQVRRNIEIAIGEGAQGVFLINHDFGLEPFLPLVRAARARFPYLWLGLNFLAVTGKEAFPVLGTLADEGCLIDAYWADDARINEHVSMTDQREALAIADAKERSGWQGLYFGGTAFKKQREVAPKAYGQAAALAAAHMDVVTTSGIATGQEADLGKIETFRAAIGDRPLALASGITADNVAHYREVDCFLVATGINVEGDFYKIEPARLRQVLRIARQMGGGRSEDDS